MGKIHIRPENYVTSTEFCVFVTQNNKKTEQRPSNEMPPKNRKKSPSVKNREDSESTEFVDAPGTSQGQMSHRNTRANPQGNETSPTMEEDIEVTASVEDLTEKRVPSRSVSPSTSGQRSKSANNKRSAKNKQADQDIFQAPKGAPPANKRSSTTVLGTSRSQKTINDYVPIPSGTHISRKDSYENQGIQMQLVNRKTEEVKKLIENNNTEMEERICKMITKGETSMLNRLEEILVARDDALEK